MTISEAPPVLAVQLKRFAMSFGFSFMSNNKITKHIQFPLQLAVPCTKSKNPVPYDLTGVVVHHGSTTHSGHYIAYVKAPNGIWYEMNDSNVAQVSVGRVQQAQAYLLFYSQKPKAVAVPAAVPTAPAATTTAATSSTKTVAEPEEKGVKVAFAADAIAASEASKVSATKMAAKPVVSTKEEESSDESDDDSDDSDDSDEESEMDSASELDSEIEDDMMDEDEDYDDDDFPPLYCTHIYRYKSPLERFRRWYWSKRPNLYKERALIRKFERYGNVRNPKMILRKYLLVRQHISLAMRLSDSDDDDDDDASASDESEDEIVLFPAKPAAKPAAAVAATSSTKLVSGSTHDESSSSSSESGSDSDESESSESESESDVESSARDEDDNDAADSKLNSKPSLKTATMDDILELSRRSRTLGSEGVWDIVSDKAKQKVDEISKQQRREDQQNRRQYRLSEWDQSLDAGHVRKVKAPKMPLQDNTGDNNPFQQVTEHRKQQKQAHLEAGEYEDFRGDVQKHHRKPHGNHHSSDRPFNKHGGGRGGGGRGGGGRGDGGRDSSGGRGGFGGRGGGRGGGHDHQKSSFSPHNKSHGHQSKPFRK